LTNEEVVETLRDLLSQRKPSVFIDEDGLEFRWIIDGIVYDLVARPTSFYQFNRETEEFIDIPIDVANVIDADHLDIQRNWSHRTFGPGKRTKGVLDHIRKELNEIEADPEDLMEWVDLIILAFDGAWRHGWDSQETIDAIKRKQAINQERVWPDWRTRSEDEAIDHNRTGE